MIAVCEVGPPTSVTRAITFVMSRLEVSAGVSSWAMTTAGSSIVRRPGVAGPSSLATVRSRTEFRSVTRSAR